MNNFWVKLAVVGLIGLIAYKMFFDGTLKGWTLMVCSEPHSTGGCAETSYVLKGYKSERECLEKGIGLHNKSGFECGSSCKMSDYGLYVCKEICNENGCSR